MINFICGAHDQRNKLEVNSLNLEDNEGHDQLSERSNGDKEVY